MRRNWSHYISNIVIGFICLIALGLIFGQVAWVLVVGIGGYLIWTVTNAVRLHRWLYSPNGNISPPVAKGLWGDLFDGLYKLQRTHKESENKLLLLINRIQESTNALKYCVIMTDNAGRMEWWNIAASRLLGFRSSTDKGQHIFNLLRSPEFKIYFARKQYNAPLEIPSPVFPHLKLDIYITLFGEDERLIIAQDVTRLYQLEQMRKDFVSNVSHEMRTPLTVISGYLETINDNIDSLPAKWQRPIKTMSAQAARMEALLTDLLLLAKVETSESAITQDKVNIHLLLETIRQDAVALSEEKKQKITLEVQDVSPIQGDEKQLRSALSNLVFNAVKYTQEGGEISLRWFVNKDGLHFSVKDNGPGFDPIHIPRLTERFYRIDPSRNSSEGGTGLGLAIVKHVVRNHDGELEIKSMPGDGSEFICHFPTYRKYSD